MQQPLCAFFRGLKSSCCAGMCGYGNSVQLRDGTIVTAYSRTNVSETHKGQVGLVGAHLGVIKWRLPKAELRVLRTDDAAHGAQAGSGATTDDTEDAGAAAAPSPPHINSQKLIWQTLEDNPGLPSYDIFVSPQLVLAKNGSILCFVGARKCAPGLMGCEDNTGQHDVLVKRSDTGGASWGHAVRVHTESTATKSVVIGNPACVLDERTGRLHVFMCRNNTEVLLSYSDTTGATWAPVRDVTAMIKRSDWGWCKGIFCGLWHFPSRSRKAFGT